jgi:hypothetical protein
MLNYRPRHEDVGKEVRLHAFLTLATWCEYSASRPGRITR